MSDQGIVTFAGVAHPWMCDAMGHMNTRHYAGMFDDATFQLLGRVAGADADRQAFGWADVRMEIDFVHEVPAGTLITIRSLIERVGTSALTHAHVMTAALDGKLLARARVVTVHFDLVRRAKAPLDDAMRTRAVALSLPANES